MTVIIARTIRKKEFKGGRIADDDFEKILSSYKEGIFTVIKGEKLPKGSRLIKIYATTSAGARRIVYLLDVEAGDAFFLLYRSKNDEIGKNITIKNPTFRRLLHAYLDMLDSDIENGDIDVYS